MSRGLWTSCAFLLHRPPAQPSCCLILPHMWETGIIVTFKQGKKVLSLVPSSADGLWLPTRFLGINQMSARGRLRETK